MKTVIQRVKQANVRVNDECINEINDGLMILVGFTEGDTEEDINYTVKKVINLRIFDDAAGIMNKSILDIQGQILSISQFTLFADTKKGNRPSYAKALGSEQASKLYELFNKKLNEQIPTKTGVFGAEMQVSLINDGPVTIIIDTKSK